MQDHDRPDDRGPELTRRRFLAAMGAAAAASAAACSAPPPPVSAPQSAPPVPTSSPAPPTPSPTPTPTGPATEVVHGPRDVSAVALTFHGAGDPALAERILASAEAEGARITVLAVGTWLQAHPRLGARILSGGHDLGNHTLHHLPMRTMDEAAAYTEIVGGRDLVRSQTAAPTWFRPSGTPQATSAILAAAGRAGYRTSLSFDVDPVDYNDPGASAVTSRVLQAVRPGSIVSLHLGHTGTAEAMPNILAGLQRQGLRPVTVTQILPGVAP